VSGVYGQVQSVVNQPHVIGPLQFFCMFLQSAESIGPVQPHRFPYSPPHVKPAPPPKPPLIRAARTPDMARMTVPDIR
jgi:hypothetical protein